jgi:DNA-binding Lrp family transcriptional regulator
MIIAVETDETENIYELNQDILSYFKGKIREKSISILVEGKSYNRNYLIGNISDRKTKIITQKEEDIKLDKIDLQILKNLSKNSREQIVNIAYETKQTERVVNYRIKNLLKDKIIEGFKIAINYEKAGIKFYKCLVYLDNPKKQRFDTLITYLEQNKKLIHNLKVISNWDLESEFEVYSEKEFQEEISKIKDEFSDIIKKIEVITISKEHKFVYF